MNRLPPYISQGWVVITRDKNGDEFGPWRWLPCFTVRNEEDTSRGVTPRYYWTRKGADKEAKHLRKYSPRNTVKVVKCCLKFMTYMELGHL